MTFTCDIVLPHGTDNVICQIRDLTRDIFFAKKKKFKNFKKNQKNHRLTRDMSLTR